METAENPENNTTYNYNIIKDKAKEDLTSLDIDK